MDTQTQIERLIELAIVQRSELKQLVSELPQLREYLSAEIERTFEETEPQIRTELEEFCEARASDEHAKTGAALAAKVEQLSKQLEVTTAAKYSVLMAERAENFNLLAKAEARIEDAASMLSHAVKEIVTDELSRFPRAGEIDQLRKEFAEPRGLNPRGRWMPDETYQRLDLVTINGDSFVSNIDGNRERPSRTAGDWTLSAARGNGGGGGGVTTMTDLVPVPSNGQLLIGNGSAFVNSTLTAGTGISISNGAGSITISATDGNITLDDGTAAAPSLNFTNEPTTGLFRASANVMGFAVNGVSRATMTTTGVTVTGTITPSGSVHAAAGSLGNPSIAFNADQNTGLYNIGPDNIGVVANGGKVLDIATTGLGITGTLSVSGVATLGAGAILNTPASGTATNLTGLPISTGVSGLGANVAAFLATPSSANLAAALTDETGTGANVFATSPTLTTPISATLTSPASTNLTLGTGTFGTALTVASATGNVGIGTASPAVRLNVADADNGANGTIRLGSSSVYGTIKNEASSTGKLVLDSVGSGAAGGISLRVGGVVGLGINNVGDVSIASSTAGAANAGALVVTGGLSAGNNGNASYFGGAVTAGGTVSLNPAASSQINFLNGATFKAAIGIDDGSSIITGAGAGSVSFRAQGTPFNFSVTSGGSITMQLSASSNLLIGTTNETGLTGAGGLKINSSTAGSASAGALVVTGGLATGAASYFGGAVTTSGSFNFNTATSQLWWATAAAANSRSWAFLNDAGLDGNFSLYRSIANTNSYLGAVVLNFDKAGAATFAGAASFAGNVAVTNTNLTGAALSARYNASNQRLGFNIQNSNGPAVLAWNAASIASSDTLNYDISQAAGKIGLNTSTGVMTLSVAASGTAGNAITFTDALSLSTTAATFAGAVSITGNVGFYGQAATAKPTSVAVTAAAIHAALVTLNLIAA